MRSAIEIRDRNGYATIIRNVGVEPPMVSVMTMDICHRPDDLLDILKEKVGAEVGERTYHGTEFNGIGFQFDKETGPRIFCGRKFNPFDPKNFRIPNLTGFEIGVERGKGLYIDIREK